MECTLILPGNAGYPGINCYPSGYKGERSVTTMEGNTIPLVSVFRKSEARKAIAAKHAEAIQHTNTLTVGLLRRLQELSKESTTLRSEVESLRHALAELQARLGDHLLEER